MEPMVGLPGSTAGSPSRLVILLDVDGVLNPEVTRDSSAMVNNHRLVVPPSRAELVRDLGSLAKIVWATTWDRGSLHQLSADLGVDIAGKVPLARMDWKRPTPKLPAVERWIARMQATGDLSWDMLVWIDDDLGPDAIEWAGEQKTPTNLICTSPLEGLQSRHVQAVRRWLHDSSA